MSISNLYDKEHFFFVQDNHFKFSSNLPLEIVEKIYQQYEQGLELYEIEGFLVHVIESSSGILFSLRPIQQYSDIDFLNPLSMKLLNSISEGITISDKNGNILFQNDNDIEIVGVNCTNRNAKDLVQEGIISDSITLKVLNSKDKVTILQTYINQKCFLVTGKPIFDEVGDLQYVIAVTRDMTHLKNLEKEVKKLEIQNQKFKQKIESSSEVQSPNMNFVAISLSMQQVISRVLRVAEVDSTILIEGESGVGKEEIAKFIYLNSRRSSGRLVTINCSAIPESLLESELFGYEAGSFTGAIKGGKAGLFETASGGTIFLDEIGEMPLLLQAKLLRVLQESEVQRVGGTKPIPIDVRIIAATNRNLSEMVSKGLFREDLFYRLNIIPIEIPPLRERREDIIPLTYHFLNVIREKYKIHRTFQRKALELMEAYDWPGNVRELKNMVERVCLLTNEPEIGPKIIIEELPEIANVKPLMHDEAENPDVLINGKRDVARFKGTLKEQLAAFEKEIIKKALVEHNSIRQAAITLGCDQSTLVRKIQKHKLTKNITYHG